MKDFIGVKSKFELDKGVILASILNSLHGHAWLDCTDLGFVDRGGLFKARLSHRLGLLLYLLLWLNMLVWKQICYLFVFTLVDHPRILSIPNGDLVVVTIMVLSNVSEVARSLPEFLAATRSQALIGLLPRVFELVLDLVDFLSEPLWTILALKPLDIEVGCVVMPC